MNTKTKTYILLAFVLVIWGVVGFKVLSAINPNQDFNEKLEHNISFTPVKIKDIDTFSIQEVEVDPFLGTRKSKKKSSIKHSVNNKLLWPVIKYRGLIKSKSTNVKLFVLVIDSKEVFVKLGQTVNGVRIERGDAKKVRVIYKGIRKTVSI